MRTVRDEQEVFRGELFEAGILVPTGIDGVYLRSQAFEEIVRGIDRLVSAAGADEHATTLHFPLVVPRTLLERTDYIRSFPDLSGTVSSYQGGELGYAGLLEALDTAQDWSAQLESTDLALCSAACHPLYPTLPTQLPAGGLRFEVFGTCFRHEPSPDPARMQTFRQHEFVYVGDPVEARRHRDRWVERGLQLHRSLGLPIEAVVANDPFFGRFGDILAASQIDEALKIELVSPICSESSPTALTSANCHLEHFGLAFSLCNPDGEVAHSACVGFGAERITLALLHTHGIDPGDWPPAVRDRLWP